MIERQHGEVAFACDTCPTTTDLVEDSDFNRLVMEAKTEGWHIEKVGGEWVHTCPDCAKKTALDRAREKFGDA